MATSKARKLVTVRTAEDLGRALGLSGADTAEMEFRPDLIVSLAKIIQSGRITHAEIAKRAGTSRTRVTVIANGNTLGVSTDVLIRVLAATGYRAEVRVKKTAAWTSRLFKIPFDSLPVPRCWHRRVSML
ncbi:MAG: XRE family transcriptional regulator [Nitrospirota bacterium]|nr:XRE family transcriptional regulator [Nitrospirota bacterium]